jgi:hypothetical protein
MSKRARVSIVLAWAALSLALAVLLWSRTGSRTALAQSPGIHVVGATSVSPLALQRGCNQVITDSPSGAAVAGIVTLVSPPAAVVSIWRFANATQKYQVGFFAEKAAPLDFASTGGPGGGAGRATEAYFVCVNQAATMTSA